MWAANSNLNAIPGELSRALPDKTLRTIVSSTGEERWKEYHDHR